MTNTLFSQQLPAGTADSFTGSNTNGVKFSVSAAGKLVAIWVSSPSGCTGTPDTVGLFNSDSGVKLFEDDAPSWSGAAGSGWIKYTLSSPITLSTGVNYKAEAGQVQSTGHKNYAITSGAVSAVTSGSLSSPANPCYWDESGSFAITNNAYNNFNIWVDVEVSFGVSASGNIRMKKMGVSGFTGETSVGTAVVRMKKMRVAASSAETSVVTAAISMKKMGVSGASFESTVVVADIRMKKMGVSATGGEVSTAVGAVSMKKMGVSGDLAQTLSYVGLVRMKKMRISASSAETSVITGVVRMKKMHIHTSLPGGESNSSLFIFSMV